MLQKLSVSKNKAVDLCSASRVCIDSLLRNGEIGGWVKRRGSYKNTKTFVFPMGVYLLCKNTTERNAILFIKQIVPFYIIKGLTKRKRRRGKCMRSCLLSTRRCVTVVC